MEIYVDVEKLVMTENPLIIEHGSDYFKLNNQNDVLFFIYAVLTKHY